MHSKCYIILRTTLNLESYPWKYKNLLFVMAKRLFIVRGSQREKINTQYTYLVNSARNNNSSRLWPLYRAERLKFLKPYNCQCILYVYICSSFYSFSISLCVSVLKDSIWRHFGKTQKTLFVSELSTFIA